MKQIDIYTDGSSLGNPGAGGYCAILKYKENKKIVCGGEKDTTNNKMELKAVIEALKVLKEPCVVNLYSDSQYVVRSINEWLNGWIKKEFKDVKNVPLWLEYIKVSKNHTIKPIWIKAHNGHPENEECDTIAKSEAQKYKI